MGFILAALAFGTFWWWGILILSIIVLIALVENDKGGWALFTILGTTYLLMKFHVTGVFAYVVQHPGRVAAYIGVYFLAGTLWGVFKWFLYVNRQLEKYNEYKTSFMKSEGVKELTPELALKLKERLAYRSSTGVDVMPQVSEHKGDITLWMTYWPFSAIWTIINDPVRRIFRFIYTHLSGSLQRISDRMFKGAHADYELASTYIKPVEKTSGINAKF